MNFKSSAHSEKAILQTQPAGNPEGTYTKTITWISESLISSIDHLTQTIATMQTEAIKTCFRDEEDWQISLRAHKKYKVT